MMADSTTSVNAPTPGTPAHGKGLEDNDVEHVSPQTATKTKKYKKKPNLFKSSVVDVKSYIDYCGFTDFDTYFNATDETPESFYESNKLKIENWYRSQHVDSEDDEDDEEEEEEEEEVDEELEDYRQNVIAITPILKVYAEMPKDFRSQMDEMKNRADISLPTPMKLSSKYFDKLSKKKKLMFTSNDTQRKLPTTRTRPANKPVEEMSLVNQTTCGLSNLVFNSAALVKNTVNLVADRFATDIQENIIELYDSCNFGKRRTEMTEEERCNSQKCLLAAGLLLISVAGDIDLHRQKELQPVILKKSAQSMTPEVRERKQDDRDDLKADIERRTERVERDAGKGRDDARSRKNKKDLDSKIKIFNALEAELQPDDVNLPKNEAIDYDLEKAFEDVVKRQKEQQKILEIKNSLQSRPPLERQDTLTRIGQQEEALAKQQEELARQKAQALKKRKEREPDISLSDGDSSDGGSSSKKSKTNDE